MMTICESLLMVAAEVSPQVRLTFKRKEGADANKYHRVHLEIQRFVDTVRVNEGMETHFERIDDEKAMTLVITLSEHEARKAIAEAIRKQAKKLAKKEDIEME